MCSLRSCCEPEDSLLKRPRKQDARVRRIESSWRTQSIRSVRFTHNRPDFETLHREYVGEERTHHGIILANRRPPHQLTARLLRLLNQLTADELKNQIFYV